MTGETEIRVDCGDWRLDREIGHDALRPLPPRVGGREKGKVRNAETELTGEKRIV